MRQISGIFNCTENMLLRRICSCKCPSTGYNRALSSFKNKSHTTTNSFSTLTHRPRCAFLNLIHTFNKLQQFSTVAKPENVPNLQGYCADTANEYTTRTHTCGELRASHIDQAVTLCGWVAFIRMDKFIHLRDAYGTTQIIVDPSKSSNITFNDLHLESVVRVKGTVCSRPASQVVTDLATGEIEVLASSIEILNYTLPKLPFHIREVKKATEKTRNQYRYLALRFPEYQRNLRLRSETLLNMREFLIKKKRFVEVETPTLFKKTPGGAQEFIVPTHVENKFYSLVQSPQQLKQLLMVGSMDRYFQIARCYRDERTTPDRQPEFTQLDLELSFTTADDVIKLTEDILAASWPSAKKPVVTPFPRMRYADAIERFGSDKPCIFDKFLVESMNEYIEGDSKFAFYYVIPDGKSHYKKLQSLFDSLAEETAVKIYVLKSDKCGESLVKILPGFRISDFGSKTAFNENDLLVVAAGPRKLNTLKMLGKCRHQTIDTFGLIDEMNAKEVYDFVWIVDFPLFEEEEGKLVSAHHPFTRPHPEDIDLIVKDPLKVRSLAYDLVLNGSEIAGGSIRIHEATLQEEILNKLNLATADFEHLLDAFKMGCPPHGGIALGLDRYFAILCNKKSIKDVIAFPKGAEGQDFMTRCPDDVPLADKVRYHLTTAKV